MSTAKFAPRTPADVPTLLNRQPLAWIASGHGSSSRATLLPVLYTLDASDAVVEISGHFARSNDQVDLLRADPHAQVLCLGEHGYISPSWMEDRTQAPTWNYASVRFLVEVRLIEEPQAIADHLRELVEKMEAGRERAWSVSEMGARYEKLARAVVGFRARVLEQQARFKLGQDERDDVYVDIVRGLTRAGSGELVRRMNDFNPGRAGLAPPKNNR